MKRIGLILLAFTLLIGCESTGVSPKVGEIAPDFSLVDISKREVRLSDFNGNKNVVLVFYQNHS
jgi:peroxiredoxin